MRREGWLWGGVLTLALTGALVGGISAIERGDAAPPPAPLDLREVEVEPPSELPPLPEGFVPDLPPVPTLPPGTTVRRAGAGVDSSGDLREADLVAEMRLVHDARHCAAADDAAGALWLLEQHRQRFPQGVLREEREVYAIEAMVALGRIDEAERRYTEFLGDFPASRFRERLARALR